MHNTRSINSLWGITAISFIALNLVRDIDILSFPVSLTFVFSNLIFFAEAHRHQRSQKIPFLPRNLIIFILIYLSIGATSSLFSDYPLYSTNILIRDFAILISALLFGYSIILSGKLNSFYILSSIILYVVIFFTLLDSLASIRIYGVIGAFSDYRAGGILGSPSANGHILSTLGAFLILSSKLTRNVQFYPKIETRALWLCLLIALICTKSGSLLISLILIFVFSNKKLLSNISPIFLLLLSPLPPFAIYMAESNNLTFLGAQINSSGRSKIFDTALAKFENLEGHHQIVGVGPGVGKYFYVSKGDPGLAGYSVDLIEKYFDGAEDSPFLRHYNYSSDIYGPVIGNSLHNIYLDVIVQYGYIGLIGFIVISTLYLFQINRSQLRKLDLPKISSFVFAIYIVRAQFETPGLIGGYFTANLPLWTIIALSLYQRSLEACSGSSLGPHQASSTGREGARRR